MKPTSSSECRSQILERPAPGDFTALVEARDFLDVHLQGLTGKQRRTLLAWASGCTCAQIAVGEGVTPEAIQQRVSGAIQRLRENAGATLADRRGPLLSPA